MQREKSFQNNNEMNTFLIKAKLALKNEDEIDEMLFK